MSKGLVVSEREESSDFSALDLCSPFARLCATPALRGMWGRMHAHNANCLQIRTWRGTGVGPHTGRDTEAQTEPGRTLSCTCFFLLV